MREKLHLVWEFVEVIVFALVVGILVQWFLIQPNKVSGSSMYPYFLDSDLILTDKITYRSRGPRRGEIIIFKSPRLVYQDYIKRIIALPGEKIAISQGKVIINGQTLDESDYLDTNVVTTIQAYLKEGQEITIAPGYYFAMGDNRSGSNDSRDFGPISKEEIIGRVVFRYWPINKIGIINPGKYKSQPVSLPNELSGKTVESTSTNLRIFSRVMPLSPVN